MKGDRYQYVNVVEFGAYLAVRIVQYLAPKLGCQSSPKNFPVLSLCAFVGMRFASGATKGKAYSIIRDNSP